MLSFKERLSILTDELENTEQEDVITELRSYGHVSYIKEDMINSISDITTLLTLRSKTPAGGTLYVDEENLICAVIYGYGCYHEKAKVYYRRKMDSEHLGNFPCHYDKCKEL